MITSPVLHSAHIFPPREVSAAQQEEVWKGGGPPGWTRKGAAGWDS